LILADFRQQVEVGTFVPILRLGDSFQSRRSGGINRIDFLNPAIGEDAIDRVTALPQWSR
jgi:hypothetical protein